MSETKLTHQEIINKLIGPISPIGESNQDEKRFENLKEMCCLINLLIRDLNHVAYSNKNAYEYSVKRASKYASDFLKDEIGIK